MENSNIKVSVIMPIYNAGEYLERAISDVLSQTLREIEIICIDDGSTDGSLALVKRMQEADARVRILTETNAGPSIARNKGISRARGEYIIFLDADDFYENTLLESLYTLAVKDELDMAVVKFDLYNCHQDKFTTPIEEKRASIFTPGAVVSKNEFPDFILESTTGYVWNKLFSTEFVREKGLAFDPEIYVFEDVYFVCAALSLAERVGRVDATLIHHRVYSDQSRAKLFRKHYAQVPVVYKKIKEHLMNHGMYIPLSRSFLNLSAGRCYKIYNLLWDEGKEEFWNLLHEGYAEELGWYNNEKTEFESEDVCEFAANVALYDHAKYLVRADKGKNIKLERLDKEKINKKIKKHHKNEKRKSIFSRTLSALCKPIKILVKPFKLIAKLFNKKEK